MATEKSSAPRAHPSTEDQDHRHHDPHDEHDRRDRDRQDQDQRPCACVDGWVFVGYEDEHGEEREASYRCRRCASEARA
jgi:hypothetical protein